MEPHNQPLPYWIFFITGFLIAAYAAFIKTTGDGVNQEAMTLFVYVGLAFILIGIIKLSYKLISKKEKIMANKLAGIDKIDLEEKRINQRFDPRPQNLPPHIYCSRCGVRNPVTAAYCSACGNSLK